MCPICSAPDGKYKDGACSQGCEKVMGEPESLFVLAINLVFFIAVVAIFGFAVLTI